MSAMPAMATVLAMAALGSRDDTGKVSVQVAAKEFKRRDSSLVELGMNYEKF